jgi:hypothetical protein
MFNVAWSLINNLGRIVSRAVASVFGCGQCPRPVSLAVDSVCGCGQCLWLCEVSGGCQGPCTVFVAAVASVLDSNAGGSLGPCTVTM